MISLAQCRAESVAVPPESVAAHCRLWVAQTIQALQTEQRGAKREIGRGVATRKLSRGRCGRAIREQRAADNGTTGVVAADVIGAIAAALGLVRSRVRFPQVQS